MQILRAADREGNRLQEPDLLFGALCRLSGIAFGLVAHVDLPDAADVSHLWEPFDAGALGIRADCLIIPNGPIDDGQPEQVICHVDELKLINNFLRAAVDLAIRRLHQVMDRDCALLTGQCV